MAAPFVFFAALVACNNIIGLTDFEKGVCPGARCAEGGLDQAVPEGGDAEGGPDGGLDAPGALPAVWARWEMPNYGEAGPGEVPRRLDYTEGGNEIRDNVSKLVWRKGTLPALARPADANARCAAEISTEWRAPKRIELATLLDYARAPGEQFIDPRFGVGPETVLTTSEVRAVNDDRTVSITNQYWAVDFSSGQVKTIAATATARVLCVKGK